LLDLLARGASQARLADASLAGRPGTAERLRGGSSPPDSAPSGHRSRSRGRSQIASGGRRARTRLRVNQAEAQTPSPEEVMQAKDWPSRRCAPTKRRRSVDQSPGRR
jgi:hypothetical protein